jgi:hypothetical protein
VRRPGRRRLARNIRRSRDGRVVRRETALLLLGHGRPVAEGARETEASVLRTERQFYVMVNEAFD